MEIDVLVSTMHQKDLSLVDKMNITTNAIIINQCDRNSFNERNDNNRTIKMYSFNERGVGKSRNNALMRSTADICILSDDDVVYLDNYKETIIKAFENNPKADIIMFNVPSLNDDRPTINITKNAKVNRLNFMRYGAVNIAFKRQSIISVNVYFSLLFGGGAKYSAGEDSLFIYECLKKGLNIYSNTSKVAYVLQDSSTWFGGFNEKYFFDKGVFFASLSKTMAYVLLMQFAIRKHHLYKNEISFTNACKCMLRGVKQYIYKLPD